MANAGTVNIRFSVSDQEVVRKALESLGKDGDAALRKLDAAGKSAQPGLKALTILTGDISNRVMGLATSIGPAGTAMVQLGSVGLVAAAAFGAFATALTSVSEGAANFRKYAREVRDGAAQTGLSIPTFQAVVDLFGRHGVEAEKASTSLNRFEAQRFTATRGQGELYQALLRTNAGLAEEFAAARSADQALGVFAKAIAGADSATQAFLTRAAFGRGSAGVTQALLAIAGQGGLGAITNAAIKSGAAFQKEVIDKQAEAAVEAERKSKIVERNWNLAFAAIAEKWRGFKRLIGLGEDNKIEVAVRFRQEMQSALSSDSLSTSDLRERLNKNRAELDRTTTPPTDDPFERAAARQRAGFKRVTEAYKAELTERIRADQQALDAREELERESHRGRRTQELPEDDRAKRERELGLLRARISLLGDAATATERSRAAELALQVAVDNDARLQGDLGRAQAERHRAERELIVSIRERIGIVTESELVETRVAATIRELNRAGVTDAKERADAVALATRRAKEGYEQLQVTQAQFRGLKQLETDAGNLNKQLDQLAVGSLGNLNSSLVDFQMGAKSGADAMKELGAQGARSLLSMMNNMLIVTPVAKALQQIMSSMFGGPAGPIASSAISLTPSALGNIFDRGNVIPFRQGGVISQPSIFPMAHGGIGLVAEVGEEATFHQLPRRQSR